MLKLRSIHECSRLVIVVAALFGSMNCSRATSSPAAGTGDSAPAMKSREDTSVAETTVAAVMATPEAWVGRRVRIVGELAEGQPTCLPRPCPPDEKCCIPCSVNLLAGGKLALRAAQGTDAKFECSGDSCNHQQSCAPSAPSAHVRYELVGTVEQSLSAPRLVVERHSPAR